VKPQWLVNALAFVGAFVSPIKELGYAIGFFVIVDLVTGMWASRREGKPITSDRFGRTVTKTIVYLIAIVVAHVAELYALPDVPLVKVVGGLVAGTELLSVYENLTRISGVDFKRRIAEWLKPSQPSKDERGGTLDA
jgi:hypothetical protein